MRSLLLACLVLTAAAPASAQLEVFRAPIVGESRAGVTATAHDTVAAALPGGDTLAAVHFDADVVIAGQRVRSLDAGRTVALVRIDRRGRARWIRRFAEEAGRGRPHLRGIHRIEPLADGGAIVGGTFGDGGLDQGIVARVGADGRLLWEVSPERATDYSHFVPVRSRRGTVALLGTFFRGRFQLPGAAEWTAPQRFSSFLAELDVATGEVRWARRIGGEGREIAIGSDGTIVVAGQFQGRLRVGRSAVRAEGAERAVFLARFDPDGAPLDAVAHATAAEDDAHGLVALADGSAAVLVSSGSGRAERLTILGYDAEGQRSFARSLPTRAALVRSRDANTVLLAVPSAARRRSMRGAPYDVVDRLDLVRLSARGSELGRRALRLDGMGVLVRSLHAEAAADRVVVSGALLTGRGSESFHLWSAAPAAPAAPTPPRAVAARVGSVL